MIKINEASLKPKRIISYYYDGNMKNLEEFITLINKRADPSALRFFIDKSENEIINDSILDNCHYWCCSFVKGQYICADFKDLDFDLCSDSYYRDVNIFSIDEDEFNWRYDIKKSKWTE
ncbi:MAG: hypothetical protein PHT94_01005 [Candidatus Nanoarchaeia archaeon]|nr:hypothetical protein [Candidatus Nanoarchaeia archaeon]